MSYGRRYSKDPRWIKATFGNCVKCKAPLLGKRALYFPNGRQCLCETCGKPEMTTFEAAAFDEAVMTGNW